ncbi:hypothetical protein AX16_001271 [Volvariella volvacea WC 439]|nr:hypothetical protein AX16_001271 [Volvariella volvacea WC 439]
MPNLKMLRFFNCDPSEWNFLSCFRSLTCLRLCLVPSTVIDFSTFGHLCNLEELEISIPRHARRSILQVHIPVAHKAVHFEFLRKFHLFSPTPAFAAPVLNSITLPSCINFGLGIACNYQTTQVYTNLYNALEHSMLAGTSLSQTSIHSLSLSPDSIVAKTRTLQAASVHPYLTNGSAHPAGQHTTFTLQFYGPQRNVPAPKSRISFLIIRPLAVLFNLQHLETLSWNHYVAEFTRAWLELDTNFFVNARGLRNIKVETCFSDFLDRLLPPADIKLTRTGSQESTEPNHDSQSESPISSAICPGLRDITVAIPSNHDGELLLDDLFGDIAKKLMQRKKVSGSHLEVLSISGCRADALSPTTMSRLKEVAHDLRIHAQRDHGELAEPLTLSSNSRILPWY